VSHVTLTPELFPSPWHVVEYQIPTNPNLSSSMSNRFTSSRPPTQPSCQGYRRQVDSIKCHVIHLHLHFAKVDLTVVDTSNITPENVGQSIRKETRSILRTRGRSSIRWNSRFRQGRGRGRSFHLHFRPQTQNQIHLNLDQE
jgi:hypothetical protein